jgi:hypothetical protein
MLQTLDEYNTKPRYIEKLRTYFEEKRSNILRAYQKKNPNEKGAYLTTVFPSLLDRQIRMSKGLPPESSPIDLEFYPLTKVQNAELYDFLNNFEIKDSFPLLIVNSVSSVDGFYMIIIGGGNGNQESKMVYNLFSL